MLGKEILGYHVDEKIGSGGFGTVYKVSKTNVTGTYVRALKHIEVPTKRHYVNILNSMGGDSTKADDYFANILKNIVGEIKILSALSESGNQNIVRYYENDVIETHSPKKYDIYILMEYLTPFPEYLDNTSLTVKDVIKLGKDILNALIACHGINIIHRDIKDDNIFVASDGTYKIGDFGVSKALKDQSRAVSIKGTPNFIAPEVYLGKENYDHTVDLYSLGIVLYRLLNNLRNPFLPAFPNAYTSEDEDIAFEARMTGKIPELPNMAKNELGEAILKAIKLRNERYNTAKEFLEALENAEKTLAPVYLAQGIGFFNVSQESEGTVGFSNVDADVTIAASMFLGQAEEQNSNGDSDLFKTIGLFNDDVENEEYNNFVSQENDKTIVVDELNFGTFEEKENGDLHQNLELNSEFVPLDEEKSRKRGYVKIVGIALIAIALLATLIFSIFFLFKKNDGNTINKETLDGDSITDFEVGDINDKDTDASERDENTETVKPSVDNNDSTNVNNNMTMETVNDIVYVLYAANIREQASDKSSVGVLGKVPFSASLLRSEKNNKWSKVTYVSNGKPITGYIPNDLITTNAKSVTFVEQKNEDGSAVITKIKSTINTNNAIIRRFPLADGYPNTFKVIDSDEFGASSIVAQIPKGTDNITVVSVSEDGVWAYIKGMGKLYNGGNPSTESTTVEGYTLYRNLEIAGNEIYVRNGDKITFGQYPQSEVTESNLKATLNAKAGTLPTSDNSQAWTSYKYYKEGKASDFMWYIDIEESGEKYRGVYFTAYRPKVTMDSSSMETTNQDDNSYRINTVYWFKYEPISWTILSEDTANETAVILCDMIIDSQAFDTSDSSNSYIQSTIRKWLNNDFYNIGFTSLQKNIIISSIVNDEKLDNVIANDNIFLLSTFDLENNSYGLTDIMLQKNVSDYSRVQGANIDDEKGVWWLKSPYGFFDTATSVVSFTGGIGGGSVVSDTSIGVVPVLRIKL